MAVYERSTGCLSVVPIALKSPQPPAYVHHQLIAVWLRLRLHDRFFVVAIEFFLGRVIGHRVFLAARFFLRRFLLVTRKKSANYGHSRTTNFSRRGKNAIA